MSDFTATSITTGERHGFRSLQALTRRLGGTTWALEPRATEDEERLVTIYRGRAPRREVVARVRVPEEAVAVAGELHRPGNPQRGVVIGGVRLPEDQVAALDAMAERRGTTRAALIREAVALLLEG